MKYCSRCILPDTRPNLVIDNDGVCNACRNHLKKDHIDWQAREAAFRQVVAHARHRSRGYDCVIPVSGGKDSTWQVITCLEYGLKPLAVTWKTPARTPLGQRNLDNLVRLGVDHIDYQINPSLERRFMLRAFERFGSTAIPMHMAIFAIPLKIAASFDIPLVVWGENSAFEYGNAAEEETGFRLNSGWLRKYGVTHGTTAQDWVGETFSQNEMAAYFGPSDDDLNAKQISAVFLGYYFRWDPHETAAIAIRHGLVTSQNGPRTGLWNYADLDDDFISIHHWLKWYKFGFTRLFDNLSIEIRNGRLQRSQAIDVLGATGEQTPIADIAKFCDFSGTSVSTFFETADRFRNLNIWRRESGVWKIPGFLISDWEWN